MPKLTLRRGEQAAEYAFTGTPLLADTLAEAGFAVAQPCGRRGVCGKCAVLSLVGQVSPPTAAEAKAGVRLACQARLLGDAQAVLAPQAEWAAIETAAPRAAQAGVPMPGRYGAAVDLGSTTVAARVYDLQTGEPLGEHALENPQAALAADVMARISIAQSGGLAQLSALAREAVRQAVAGACRAARVPRADALTVAGNTVMLYLLTGRDPGALGVAPFEADCLFGLETALDGVPAYLPRCAGAFMGADLTCAALATGLCDTPVTALLCDIGTNGECMLWHGGVLYAASAPAGPAFEGGALSQGCGGVRGAVDRVWVEGGVLGSHVIGGGQAVGLCGSGVIDALAALLSLGRIDASGAADAPYLPVSGSVGLTAGDIRAVQLAKAAVAAAIGMLMDEAGIAPAQVRQLWLAGGFGSHISESSAAAIGMIPPELAPRAQAAGNAALAGTAMLLLDTRLRARADALALQTRVVQLGGREGFDRRFIDALAFPYAEE